MSLDGQSVGQNGESLQRYITLSGLSGGRWAKQAAVAEKLIPHTAGASDRKDGQRQRSVAVGRSVGQSADISIQWSQEAGRHPRIHDPRSTQSVSLAPGDLLAIPRIEPKRPDDTGCLRVRTAGARQFSQRKLDVHATQRLSHIRPSCTVCGQQMWTR